MQDNQHAGFQTIPANNLPEVMPEFTKKTNVADERLGAKALFATDDFFAPRNRMLNPNPALFVVGKFDDNGKWMDGWETRRKRHLGYDYAVIALARPTRIAGFDIDTSHFTGNFPSSASMDTLYAPDLMDKTDFDKSQWDSQNWQPLLPLTPLKGNTHHLIATDTLPHPTDVVTHIRLNIYPDGGVARLRIYGDIVLDQASVASDAVIDLVGALNGGRAIASNDAHFGGADNLLLPNKAPNMGEGWETRRRREPGNDWCILKLGQAGVVEKIEIDTAYFKGNFPDKISIQAVYAPDVLDATAITQSMFWETLLDDQPLSAHNVHTFSDLKLHTPITHVRVNIYPDGGLSRVKLFGKVAKTDA